MKSTITINRYLQPDLNQGCLDWKAGVLTTILTVLADRDNYSIHIGKRALMTEVTEDCFCLLQIYKQKRAKTKNGNIYTRVQIVHFYWLLQVDVIREKNSLGYIGRQVNSLTGLSSLIFSPNPGEVNS